MVAGGIFKGGNVRTPLLTLSFVIRCHYVSCLNHQYLHAHHFHRWKSLSSVLMRVALSLYMYMYNQFILAASSYNPSPSGSHHFALMPFHHFKKLFTFHHFHHLTFIFLAHWLSYEFSRYSSYRAASYATRSFLSQSCPSVRLSVRHTHLLWRNEPDIRIPYVRSIILLFRHEEWLVRDVPFCLKFWAKLISLLQKRRFPIDIRSYSASVLTAKKIS